MIYTLRFFSLSSKYSLFHNSNLVPVLLTFYIQGVLKLKKNNSGAERLILPATASATKGVNQNCGDSCEL